MFDRLPNELVLQIMISSAHVLVSTDRKSLVSVAQTCRLVYDLVAPILYTSMVMGEPNSDATERLAANPHLAHRVCRHVRYLLVTDFYALPSAVAESDSDSDASVGSQSDTSLGSVFRFFESLCFLSAESRVVRLAIDDLPDVETLTSIQLWDDELDDIPRSVTHLGFWLGYTESLDALAAFIAAAPHIRHFAFETIAFSDNATHLSTDVLENGLRAALRHEHIQSIAMRVAGVRGNHQEAKAWIEVVRRIGDERLLVWHDTRDIPDAVTEIAHLTDDAYKCQNIWTMATAV